MKLAQALFLVLFLTGHFVAAQDNSAIDKEFEDLGEQTIPVEPETTPVAQPEVKKENKNNESETYNMSQDRFPKAPPQFVKPAGPKGGGKVRVLHPNANKGLMEITADGTYIYKTKSRPKSMAGSLKFMSMSPPKIEDSSTGVSYESLYGKDYLTGLAFDYEWQPFTGFGRLGLDLGIGVTTTRGAGVFKATGAKAEENYTLYVVPISTFLVYRFEYARRQWFVPFVNGGITYFGLSESRDDGKKPAFYGAAAAGGGGGVHISISNLDSSLSFTLAEEYGISDLWLTVEARALKGLNKETDFTTNMLTVGFTADY